MGQITRTMAREIAMHIIFSVDYSPENAEAVIGGTLSPEGFSGLAGDVGLYGEFPDENNLNYILRVTRGVSAHMTELDGYIEKYAIGWSFARMSRVCKCLLRLCMFELLYMPEIPPRAAINEAIELAKKYDNEDVPGFINGVLASFAKLEMMEGTREGLVIREDKPGLDISEDKPSTGQEGEV